MQALKPKPPPCKSEQEVPDEKGSGLSKRDLEDTSTARLALLALEGSRDAWDELIRRFDKRVELSLLARGVHPQLARDLTQETWVRLLRQQHAGKLKELKLPGLAIAQAWYLALSHFRRADPAQPSGTDKLPEDADGGPSPEAEVLGRQRLQLGLREVKSCPPRARRIFLMVYQQHMSYATVARREGISQQRVRQTLCEVRAQIRAALEAE